MNLTLYPGTFYSLFCVLFEKLYMQRGIKQTDNDGGEVLLRKKISKLSSFSTSLAGCSKVSENADSCRVAYKTVFINSLPICLKADISANPGFNFNPRFFFFHYKRISRIIFFVLFRSSNIIKLQTKRILKTYSLFNLSYLNLKFALTLGVILTQLCSTRF